MRHKRIIAVTVVCLVVALIGISLLLSFFQSKPVVLAANSHVTPSPTPVTATLEIFQAPVYVMLPDREAIEDATNGMSIPQGTIISTGTAGRAQIMYPGGTVTRLDSSTTVKLTTYNTQKYQIVVNIFQGKIWSRIKKLLGNESYETKTSNTVATVRGTSYEHSVTELDEDGVLVLEGKVDFECSAYQKLKTSLEANKKAVVHCNIDTEIKPAEVTEKDLEQEWVTFNNKKNDELKKNLNNGFDPAQNFNINNRDGEKNNDTSPTNNPDTTNERGNTKVKDNGNGKDKDKKNPSPTSIIRPTDIVGAVDSTVDTVVDTVDTTVNRIVTAVPTLPPILRSPTNTPVPATQPPAATATPAPAGVNVDINVGDLNVGLGLGKDKLKVNLGNGNGNGNGN
jgi:hypothetical protein